MHLLEEGMGSQGRVGKGGTGTGRGLNGAGRGEEWGGKAVGRVIPVDLW